LTRVADDREDFATKADLEDKAEEWLMMSLVDQCLAAGLKPRENQCYAYKTPPVLGGSYSIDNVFAMDIAKHYAFLGDIFRQTKDLPDGTRVEICVARVPRGSEAGYKAHEGM
jgi:hypothetical protein